MKGELLKLNKDLLIKIIEDVNDVKKWSVEQLINNKNEIEKEMNRREKEVSEYYENEKKNKRLRMIKDFLLQFSEVPQFTKIIKENREQIENLYDCISFSSLSSVRDYKLLTNYKDFTEEFVDQILNISGEVDIERSLISYIFYFLHPQTPSTEPGHSSYFIYYLGEQFLLGKLIPELKFFNCDNCGKLLYMAVLKCSDDDDIEEIWFLDPSCMNCKLCYNIHCVHHPH